MQAKLLRGIADLGPGRPQTAPSPETKASLAALPRASARARSHSLPSALRQAQTGLCYFSPGKKNGVAPTLEAHELKYCTYRSHLQYRTCSTVPYVHTCRYSTARIVQYRTYIHTYSTARIVQHRTYIHTYSTARIAQYRTYIIAARTDVQKNAPLHNRMT